MLLPDCADRSKLTTKILIECAEDEKTDSGLRGWLYATKSLFSYREGNFVQAAGDCKKSLAFNNGQGQDGVLALLVQAMALDHLAQPDEARKSLAGATALIPAELATLGSGEFQGRLPLGYNFIQHDYLIAEIFRREASRLILGDAHRR